jgi:hypothetical protein
MLVTKFGEMWAKNPENLETLLAEARKGQGVYILYDGSMPMYVGKGYVHRRIRLAAKSPRRREFWDHFSWYLLSDLNLMHDIEALLLRALPQNLRVLTEQSGHFEGVKSLRQKNSVAVPINRKQKKRKKRS